MLSVQKHITVSLLEMLTLLNYFIIKILTWNQVPSLSFNVMSIFDRFHGFVAILFYFL